MDIASVYLHVIRNVVDGVRADFSTEQLDEKALATLATLWEHKLMSSGALDANRVEPKKEEGEQAAPRVPPAGPAEPAEPAEQTGVKRKFGEMDGADATAAPEVEKQDPKPSEPADGDAAAKADKLDGGGGNPGPAAEAAPAEKGETLSSDSDDDDALHGAQGVDVSTGNLILAQFDKVSHSKNKWKCSLKGGVMTLNDKDVLFGKANGEFTW